MSPKVYSFLYLLQICQAYRIQCGVIYLFKKKFLMTIMAQVFICSAILNTLQLGFPDGTVVKNLPASARDMGSSPGPGRSHMPRSN